MTHLGALIVRVFQSTLNIFPQWISKPQIRKPKNHRKSSSGAGRFAQNLRASKKSQYTVKNYTLGRQNRRCTFKYRRSRYKPISTNIPYSCLMVKGRKRGNSKDPSRCRQIWMICSLDHCQDITVHKNTKSKSSLWPFKELNISNSDLSTNSEYDNRSNINFPLHHALNQVDLNTDLCGCSTINQKQGVLFHTNRYWRKMATRENHA